MTSPSPLARLPHALIHSIFTFALVPASQRGLGAPRGGAPPELKTLATVSREWNEYARNVASALTLRELSLSHPKITTRQDLLELRRRLVLRRAFLRALTISYSNQHTTDRGKLLSLGQWRAIMTHAPQLEALDLKWMVRDDAVHIAAMVRAAKRHCPLLRSLVLPSLRPLRSGHASESPANTQLLMDAVLEKGCGPHGLRALRFPIAFTSMPRSHEKAITYLSRICDVCPNIETLDGYVRLVDNNEQLSSDEQWHIDANTWERFCRTTYQLKCFDWIVAPFSTTFFDIFGRYSKPKLEKLVFSTPMNWDWDQYHLQLSIASRPTSGYGATARNAHAALKACPSLRDLEVAVYLPGDGGDEDDDDGFGWDVYGALPDRRTRVPDEPMLDQEIFGDEFCEHVARHCQQLEKFTIWRVLEASNVVHTIMTFTDRAMRALATLPVLRWVELKSVNISGDGLFALAACFAPHSESAKLQREFVITVGDEKGTSTDMAFFETVERFLELLVQCAPDQLPCANRSVALRVHNGRMNVNDRMWAKEYLSKISLLATAATTKHPSVRLRLLTRRYDRTEKSCDDIMEFGFYTATTTLNAWWGWENEPQDTRIDGFVLCRGNLQSGGRPQARHTDDDDNNDEDMDDDEYGDY